MLEVAFWNIWGHRVADEVDDCLRILAEQDVDIICLTEVTHMGKLYVPAPVIHSSQDRAEPPSSINGFDRIYRKHADAYEIHYYSPTYNQSRCVLTNQTFDEVGFGSALLVNRKLGQFVVVDVSVFETNDDTREKARVLQSVLFEHGGTRYLVAHLHGIWIAGNTKGDDPRRNEQSLFVRRQLRKLCKEYDVEKVVFGGDLNLAIDTEALQLLETGESGDKPWRNLIKEYDVASTRTPRYREFGAPGKQHADYILVSENVQVADLFVDTDNHASDHAPLHVAFL